MNNSLLQKGLEKVYEKFRHSTASMLVVTGTIGWALSSAAQIYAIYANPKLKKEQRKFLVPQAFWDAAVNIGSFFVITQTTKKFVSKLASSGKIAPQKVRDFLNKNNDLYGDKVGKLSLDLDKVLKNEPKFPTESYYTYKNSATTFATVGASIFASNIVTPIIRNSFASRDQKRYLDARPQRPSGDMKI